MSDVPDSEVAPAQASAGALDPSWVEDFVAGAIEVDPTPPAASIQDLAEGLRSLPLPPGSLVMIAMANSEKLLRSFFAVLRADCVPLLVAPSTPPLRIRDLAVRLGASALLRTRIMSTDHHGQQPVRMGDVDVLRFEGAQVIRHRPGQVVLLTSGTSGVATGCLHELSALLRNGRRHAEAIGLRAGDRVLVNLPVYYSFALVAQVLASLQVGAELVLTGPPFTPVSYARALEEHRVTVSSLTPLLVTAVLRSLDELPAGLRVLTVGGQALPAEQTAELLRRYPGKELYLTYGLTEAGPRVTTLAAHREPAHRHHSAGLPLEGVELSLRDVGRGDGLREVLVRSDTVYLRRLGPVAASTRGGLAGPGVVATGDLGTIDADGYLYLGGRLSDFAMIGGEKVSLASIRQLTESIDGVLRAVPTVQDPHLESAWLALDVYVNEQARLTEDIVRRRLSALLATSERPRLIQVHVTESGTLHK